MGRLVDILKKLRKPEDDENKQTIQCDIEQSKKDYVQKMYTFSSIFPNEEIMERSMKIIHESESVREHDDSQER